MIEKYVKFSIYSVEITFSVGIKIQKRASGHSSTIAVAVCSSYNKMPPNASLSIIAALFYLMVQAEDEDPFFRTIGDKYGEPLDRLVIAKSKDRDFRGNRYAYVVSHPGEDFLVSRKMILGTWEGKLNNFFDRLLARDTGKNATIIEQLQVVDIGANFGAFSLHVAKQGIRLHSFEMQPRVFQCLDMSRRLNDYTHHWRTYHAALWEVDGKEVDFQPALGNFGSTSLIANFSAPREKNFRPELAPHIKMTTQRLDSILPAAMDVFFLKLDVENSELYVLKGYSSALAAKKVKHLVVELRDNQQDVVDYIYDHGYNCSWKTFAFQFTDRDDLKHIVTQLNDCRDFYCTVIM